MKIEIPQIFWHGNKDRIFSIDFYPNSNFLVTCGAEPEDKMWIKVDPQINLVLGNRTAREFRSSRAQQRGE